MSNNYSIRTINVLPLGILDVFGVQRDNYIFKVGLINVGNTRNNFGNLPEFMCEFEAVF